jgi:cytoskeleton protein RodZ
MPPIGDSLREARMRQKLDIADVEERTKIRAKYLRALENEEFGLLPGPTTVRAFLRTYAQILGLDPHVLLEEFRVSHEPPDEMEPQPLAADTSPPQRRMPSGPPIGPPGRGVVVAGLLVALLALLLILGLSSQDDSSTKGTSGDEAKTQQRKPAPKKKVRKHPPPPKGVAVNVAPVDATYVCIDKGAGTPPVFQGTISEPRSFKGSSKLRINLGKSSATVKVNGRRVPIERTANPVGFEFTPTATKPLPSGQRPCA